MSLEIVRTYYHCNRVDKYVENTQIEVEMAVLISEEIRLTPYLSISRVIKSCYSTVKNDPNIDELFKTLLASPGVNVVTTRKLLENEEELKKLL